MKSEKPSTTDVEALRAFNRFFTQRIGVLDPYLGSDLSLTEVRVLYELHHRDPHKVGVSASELGLALGIDAAYLSRILRRFEQRAWVRRTPSVQDGRRFALHITAAGRRAFAPLQRRSQAQAAATLAPLAPTARRQALAHMAALQNLLSPGSSVEAAAPASPSLPIVTLRDPQPGDMGWVVQQHAQLYAREFGWNRDFEALVADIVAGMIHKHDPAWERSWIAELDRGEGPQPVGSVFVVRKSATVAQLRLLLLTPPARGLGLGQRLTDTCIQFARDKGYRKLMLWTHANLVVARAIYAQRGFVLTRSEPYRAFGHDLVSEFWELKL